MTENAKVHFNQWLLVIISAVVSGALAWGGMQMKISYIEKRAEEIKVDFKDHCVSTKETDEKDREERHTNAKLINNVSRDVKELDIKVDSHQNTNFAVQGEIRKDLKEIKEILKK